MTSKTSKKHFTNSFYMILLCYVLIIFSMAKKEINLEEKIEKIVKKVSLYMVDLNYEYIKTEIFKAYNYANEAHKWQKRLSGEPYITHPIAAAEILIDLKPDIYSIQACLLHDVVEDTPKTAEDIKKDFWGEVAFLCEGLAKLSKIRYKWEERDVWSLRKMLVAMAEDLRVIFIKLSDRLHNMKTLRYHPNPIKRNKIALETLNLFSPIADRLWLYSFKEALNEECFKILEPKEYRRIKKEMDELKQARDLFTKNAKSEIDELLKWEITNYKIDYRVKSIYSIYRKLIKKGLNNTSELFDLFWIRIMVESESDCYKVLWLVHKKWTPVPKRFKDYIALPKPNWYRSLHTTVMWIFEKNRKTATEIQIKTFKMLEYSDIWVAAHFEYKEKWSQISKDIEWVKDLKEMVESVQDNDFVGSLKVDIFKDRIFVFTPKWDFIDLPAWSTPIDFAYSVHSDLWDHISVARVNNSVYPLDKELKNWDVVEIVTDKNKKPNPFRMSFVKTVKAKNKIRASMKKEDKELHRERWKEMLTRYFEKFWLKLDKDLAILKNIDNKNLSMEERLWILEQVWNFSIPPASVIKRLLKNNDFLEIKDSWIKDKKLEDKELNREKAELTKGAEEENNTPKANLVIWWEKWLDYKLCSCSRKKLWKNIVAHINNKWVLTIHNTNCKILKNVNKDRLLTAYIDWEREEILIVRVKLLINNKLWILKEITDTIFSMWINLEEISTKKIWNTKIEIKLDLSIPDYDYLIIDRFFDRLKINLKENLFEIEMLWIKKE